MIPTVPGNPDAVAFDTCAGPFEYGMSRYYHVRRWFLIVADSVVLDDALNTQPVRTLFPWREAVLASATELRAKHEAIEARYGTFRLANSDNASAIADFRRGAYLAFDDYVPLDSARMHVWDA